MESLSSLLMVDGSPDIEGAAFAVDFSLGASSIDLSHHSDRAGFAGPNLPFVAEIGAVGRMENILLRGQNYVNMMYTFRSCARAMSQVMKTATASEEIKMERDLAAFRVLRPEMKKIKELADFQHVVVTTFCEEVDRIGPRMSEHDSGSELLKDKLVQLVDMLVILDYIKDSKASIKDDFTAYKRILHSVKDNDALEEPRAALEQERERLQFFLSDPSFPNGRYIFENLRRRVQAVPNHEAVLVELISHCVRIVSEKRCLTLEEMHRPRRVLPFLLNLLDGSGAKLASDSKQNSGNMAGSSAINSSDLPDGTGINVFKHKDIDIQAICKICREFPVIPLYLDMTVTLVYILRACPHFDYNDPKTRRMWSEDYEGANVVFESRYALGATKRTLGANKRILGANKRWLSFRRQHSQYMVELQLMLSRLTNAPLQKKDGTPDVTLKDAEECYETILRGLRLLSNLTVSVRNQAAWKQTHAAQRYHSNVYHFSDLGSDSKDKKRATKSDKGNLSDSESEQMDAADFSAAESRETLKGVTAERHGKEGDHKPERKRRMSSREVIAAAAAEEKIPESQKIVQRVEKHLTAKAIEKDVEPDEAGIEYALAVGRNYSPGELEVLVDVISMIKSLASLLKRAEGVIAPVLRLHIHHEVQRFLQHTVLTLLYKAQKHKRDDELGLLLQIRQIAADWAGGEEPFEDYKIAEKARAVRKAYESAGVGKALSSEDAIVIGGRGKRESEALSAAYDEAKELAPLPRRCVAPSNTQLYLLRTLVQAIYDARAPWVKRGKGFFGIRSIYGEMDVNQIRNFVDRSFYFPHLLNFGDTVRELSDVSWLWFREFHMELTKQVQFPINMSLPWILAEYVVFNPGNNMLENVFYALDIYNDAAHSALHLLGQRFVFDEIEAEVNLVFDQLLFLLNKTIYSHFKNAASMNCLDKPSRTKLESESNNIAKEYHHARKNWRKTNKEAQEMAARESEARRHHGLGSSTKLGFVHLAPFGVSEIETPNSKPLPTFTAVERQRYESIMSQRHVHLLGKSVNLNSLLRQRINESLRKDVEAAVLKFESGDLCGIVEYEMTLNVQRETHAMLASAFSSAGGSGSGGGGGLDGGTGLDDFDIILAEVEESVSSTTLRGRVAMHVLLELVLDVLPNWVFDGVTQRFLKPATGSMRQKARLKRKEERRKRLGKVPPPDEDFLFGTRYSRAYESTCRLHREFLGRPHFDAIVRLLEKNGDLPMLLDELKSHISDLVIEYIGPYVGALKEGLYALKLPDFQLRAGGCYMAIQLHLKDILNYEDLRSEVFQHFRELGNTLALFHVLEQSVQMWDNFTFMQSATFLGITPDDFLDKLSADANKKTISSSVPLVNHVQDFVSRARYCSNVMKGPVLDSLVEFSHRTSLLYGGMSHEDAGQAPKVVSGAGANATREHLLRVALSCLREALDEANEEMQDEANEEMQPIAEDAYRLDLWDDDKDPSNGVMHVETTRAFHRLFSALLFDFCEPSHAQNSSTNSQSGTPVDKNIVSLLPDAAEFGDGMLWGGGAIIHVLGQQDNFCLLDFSSHILSASEWEKMHENAMVGTVNPGVESTLPDFLENAKLSLDRLDELFMLFASQNILPAAEQVVVFKPPLDDSPNKMGNSKVEHIIETRRMSHLHGNSSRDSIINTYGQGQMSVITRNTLDYDNAMGKPKR